MLFAQCMYDPVEQDALFIALIDYLQRQVELPENRQLFDVAADAPRDSFFEEFKGDILRTLAVVKNRSFSKKTNGD